MNEQERAMEAEAQEPRQPSPAADPGESREAEEPEAAPEKKPVQSPEERARQAAGRRLRERDAAARKAAREEIEETLRKRGVVDPRTGRPVESLEELEREPEYRRSPVEDTRVTAELEEIRRMDPEMADLGCILRSENGERFRRYVRRGLSFTEAYKLAAEDRLARLRAGQAAEAALVRAASKDHLNATGTRGQGAVSVPPEEMSMFRALLPGASSEEIQRYYNADRKRFGKPSLRG